MFAIKSSVLTAALLGHNAFAVDAAGCYPAYADSGDYDSGSQVSASTTTETTETVECSPAGTSTCPDSGLVTTTTTTTTTSNYQCVDNTYSAFCGNSAYAPGNAATANAASLAWTNLGECSGTASVPAPTPPPTPALWSGGGCPKAYALGSDYSAGSVVTVAGAAFSTVYQCKESPSDQWCPLAGYEPGSPQSAWDQAWTEIGSCVGTIAPTTSPNYVTIPDAGGCPAAFSAGETYEEGDKVAVDGLVYQCKTFPQGLHCSQDGYEPGSCLSADVCYWKEAWTVAGFCDGTIAPTTAPNYVTLQDMGGCPDAWAEQTYEAGDKVSDGSLVYECKDWPFSGHCGQAGYEPNVSPAAPDAWKTAWTVLGHCSGSIAPTTSPNFDKLGVDTAGCPEPWSAAKNDYEPGDLVSYRVSTNPERDVIFKCKDWPSSGYCSQGTGFEPTTTYGHMAWDLHGACSGTMAPTTSPFGYTDFCRYDRCRDEDRTETSCTPGSTGCSCLSGQDPGPTCTRDYTEEVCVESNVNPWTEGTDYQTGDVVRAGVKRFKCREWPNGLWCGIAAYQPVADDSSGGALWRQAWRTDGTCGECGEIVPADSDIRVKVTLVDDLGVNVNNTAYGSYNMRVVEQFDGGDVVFVNQKDAKVWRYADGGSPTVVYDKDVEGLPPGINPETNRPSLAFNAAQQTKIHTVAQGPTPDTMIVVFSSTTIPSNYAGTPLAVPDNQEFKLWSEGDCDGLADFDSVCKNWGNPFPPGYGCCTSQQVYKVFYKLDINATDGRLINVDSAVPFFAYEIQQTYGHDGGGSLMTSGGQLLWAVGDCLPFGYSGLSASQDMNSHCGKMLLIDPAAVGSYQIVAKGVRNCQQMFLLPNDNVLWMEIGGVTAEEVNQVPLADLLDTSEIENFGWGIRPGENFAREGSFKVDEGSRFGAFGVEPACIDEQSAAEQVGFLLPYMEFANPKSAGGAFYGVSGAVASTVSFSTIKVAASLFNEVVGGESISRLVVGIEDFTKNSPIQAYHASLWQEKSGELVEMTRGFNDLVRDLQLGTPIGAGDFYPNRTPWRGDARVFQLPDGSAGVLIERLGKFYKLEEL